MKFIFKLIVAIFVACVFYSGYAAGPDLEILRKKVISELLQPEVDNSKIKSLVATISPDGTWPGINYIDVSRTGFQHGEHLANITSLSRAYKKPGSPFKGNRKVKETMYLALNYWLANDFICDNWWWNQIGTPDQFVRFMLVMDNDLTKEQVSRCIPIATRANLNASGARPSGDRIKIAGILAKNALFQRNDSLFDEVIKVIEGEIKVATGPGLQADLSFQHRPDKVISTLSYGTGFADAFAEWAAFVAGTKYSFSEKSLSLLTDYYLDGICQSMVYGKYPDPGAKNRDMTRQGCLQAYGTETPERLLKASSYRKPELENIIRTRKGEGRDELSKARFFWASEYFSIQRPGYFTSVRMFSSRNHNMEMPYNGEGLLNHHYADGSNFISRTGEEYYDISPVFDWQKIPGTTIVQKTGLPPETEIQKEGLTEFVGAVTDGVCGAASFDFRGLLDPVVARKAWFFFDKEYVCLGTGISSSAGLPVVTTINQCLLKGDVLAMNGNKVSSVSKGEHELDNVKWVLHDGVGYLFPEPAKLNLSNQAQSGSWFRINRQSDSPKEEISLDVFKLWIEHGNKPVNAEYQYIVIPSADADAMEAAANRKDIEILYNTSDIQAVRHAGLKMTQAVFHRAGKLELSKNVKLTMDSPGLVMVVLDGSAIKSISVADPSRKLGKIHLSVSSRVETSEANFRSLWNDKERMSEITIDLPQGAYAGQSVTVDLK